MTNDFLQSYTDDVYHQRDPSAPARYIADPCLRHEAGELITMSLAHNEARIAAFLAKHAVVRFRNRLVTTEGEYITSCYEGDLGNGNVMSGIEVFRVVDGKITETWNASPASGAWG
jgi:hypothetical protein